MEAGSSPREETKNSSRSEAISTAQSKPVSVRANPLKRSFPKLEISRGDDEQSRSNLWQVYLIGAFLIGRWAWFKLKQRREERRRREEDEDEDEEEEEEEDDNGRHR